MITLEDFKKLELRVGKIFSVEEIEGAEKLYKLKVSLGTEERQLVAGIKKFYSPEDLEGKQIIVVSNLEPAKLRGVESQGMLLAALEEGGSITLVTTDRPVKEGSKIS